VLFFLAGFTFTVQGGLDLHHIPLGVEIGEGSHRSEGSPTHVLLDGWGGRRGGKNNFDESKEEEELRLHKSRH